MTASRWLGLQPPAVAVHAEAARQRDADRGGAADQEQQSLGQVRDQLI